MSVTMVNDSVNKEVAVSRRGLLAAVEDGTDPGTVIQTLLYIDCPLVKKFEVLNFCELLKSNGKSAESLRKLIMALRILEKYGRHLLKAVDARSNMWRYIKYTNSIFRERVDAIEGGRAVMGLMGYTENILDGVAFPEGAQPDHVKISHLVADILLGKRELNAYLDGTHPHSHYLEEYLNPALVNVLRTQKDPGTVTAELAPVTAPVPAGPSSSGQEDDNRSRVTGPIENSGIVQDIVCDICGRNNAVLECQVCGSKQMCVGCDKKWHSHPKRQNHQLKRLNEGAATEQLPEATTAITSTGGTESGGPRGKDSLSVYYTPPSIQQHTGLDPDIKLPPAPDLLGKPGGQRREGPLPTDMEHVPVSSRPADSGEPYYTPPMAARQYIPEQPGAPLRQHQGQPPSLIPHQSFSPFQDQSMHLAQKHLHEPVRVSSSLMFPAQIGNQQPYSYTNPYTMGTVGPGLQHLPYPGNSVQGHHGQGLPQGASIAGYPSAFLYPSVPTSHEAPVGYNVFYNSPQVSSSLTGSSPSPQTPLVSPLIGHGANVYGPSVKSPYGLPSISQGTLGHSATPGLGQGTLGHSATPGLGQGTLGHSATPHLGQGMLGQSTIPRLPKTSTLLSSVMAIPNLNKRRSRIEVHLMNLREDLTEWEKQLNNIILSNQNFFEDAEYIALVQRKRKHLLEISELEKYGKELDDEMEKGAEQTAATGPGQSESHGPPPMVKPEYMPAYSLPDTQQLPKAPAQVKYQYNPAPSSLERAPVNPPERLEPATGMGDKPGGKNLLDQSELAANLGLNIPVNDLGKRDRSSGGIEGNIRESGALAATGPKQVVPVSGHKSPNFASGQDRDKPRGDKILNLGAPSTGSAPHIPSTHSEQNLCTGAREDRDPATLLRKSSSTPAMGFQWQCEHCTYINSANTWACAVCCKTSLNPTRIQVQTQQQARSATPPSPTPVTDEPCEFCTYMNKVGTRVCGMCARTQSKYMDMVVEPPIVSSEPVKSKQDVTSVPKHSNVGEKIAEEQDKVYEEKMAAQRQYKKSQMAGGADAPSSVQQAAAVGAESGTRQEDRAGATAAAGAEMKVLSELKKSTVPSSSCSSNSSYNSANSSFEQEVTSGSNVKEQKASSLGRNSVVPDNLNFADAIKLISEKREKEQMSLDGHEMIRLIKTAEKAGFDIEEVTIALERSAEERLLPLDWLEQKWQALVDLVVTMATEHGKQLQENNVGEMSMEEARESLKSFCGDTEQAIKKCIADRQEKFAMVSTYGQYAREDVLTALYQNKGCLEDTVDQLNTPILQGFTERLWSQQDEDSSTSALLGALRAANYMAETSNSVSNSVIGHEAFQQIVKNKEIDTERRIRMVFVEARLKSWGRAETVVAILDNDVANPQDPLDCSFEDIVEAVRNCGDRRSSLVYLKQECGICYGYFPMSKIRNLGHCECKLCQGCLKQNFEVAIRERFVRNWTCPLCEQPDLEDESRAADYLGFLQLMLQTLVDQEVMSLYDTKLRDWHLQKDPNFRWCAHCACGFIAAGGGRNPAMTCPSCQKKTCYDCKKQWEPQHEGLTCEQFTQWKIDNDPENQASGLARHLEENGIDCPSCKMRYSLAKGGCMHFKCPQCGHEFCSGCSQPFLQHGICNRLRACKNKGLHCHHPRDCFYYLRDNDPNELQQLLKDNRVPYNEDPPARQADRDRCPVMEQKEYGVQKKDEACGLQVQQGMAGLCQIHYKEYLVGLINKNKLDPILIMDLKQMEILIQRQERQVPKQERNENGNQYKKRVTAFIQKSFPLSR